MDKHVSTEVTRKRAPRIIIGTFDDTTFLTLKSYGTPGVSTYQDHCIAFTTEELEDLAKALQRHLEEVRREEAK